MKNNIHFKKIASDLRDLALEDSEEEYYNEFINILFKDGLLTYESSEHDTFIKSNRDYISALETRRRQEKSRFIIMNHLKDMYNELRVLNKNIDMTNKKATQVLIAEYEGISGHEKHLANNRKVVFLVDKKLVNKKEIIVCEMNAGKPGEQYSPYEDATLHREVVNTFRRPKAYLRALERGLDAFNSVS